MMKMSEEDRQVQESSNKATWKAIEEYRFTGDLVPYLKDGQLAFATVAEAQQQRDDCEIRKREMGDWRLKNLREQFAAAKMPLTPDVWDRLEADRRQALEDDLVWIRKGREEQS